MAVASLEKSTITLMLIASNLKTWNESAKLADFKPLKDISGSHTITKMVQLLAKKNKVFGLAAMSNYFL